MDYQEQIDRHFDATAQHWKDLYDDQSIEGVIHRHRRALALRWIQELALAHHARVLEVGGGAGLLAINLAQRNYDVNCIDRSRVMVELAVAEAADANVGDHLVIDVGDVHALNFESGIFDLVVALGVFPFLHTPEKALAEISRVLRPDSWVLFTADNKYRLNRLLDPRYVPFPGREALKQLLTVVGAKERPRFHVKFSSYSAAKVMVEGAGLAVVRCVTLGFGPFTFLARDLLSEPRAIRLHGWLQERADRRVFGLRSLGAQHLILARKV